MTTIAVDMDSTMAGILLTVFDRLEPPGHNLSYENVRNWGWSVERYGLEPFLAAVWASWTETPRAVPPMEDGLYDSLKAIRNHVDTLDVVTAQRENDEVTRGKITWLEYHGLSDFVDSVVPVGMDTTKAHLGYDYLVDDKPSLVANCVDSDTQLFLRDQPYNRGVDGDHVIRVRSMAQVVDYL